MDQSNHNGDAESIPFDEAAEGFVIGVMLQTSDVPAGITRRHIHSELYRPVFSPDSPPARPIKSEFS